LGLGGTLILPLPLKNRRRRFAMNMEDQVREAVIDELTRQALDSHGALRTGKPVEGRLHIEGDVDLDALAMAVVGSVAGGP
jgi:hypothetical protein